MKIVKTIITVMCATALVSCESFFEQTPDNMLDGDKNYTERSNVYASFMGLYGTLQDLAPHLIIMSELQGDLMSPTDQAPDNYWEIFRYNTQTGNSAADPSLLYRVVMNCNDFLRNAIKYNKSYPGVIPQNTYRQMIAGAVTLRSWTYLNIGKLYGKAVYYDYAMTGEVDLSKLPVIEFDALIQELIYFMNTGADNINGMHRVDIDDMFGMNGPIWRRLAISPDALMCELFLWAKDYESAAKKGINLISGRALLDPVGVDNLTLSGMFGGASWVNIFKEIPSQSHTNEVLSMVLYDYSLRQINPLFSLFSAQANQKYYFKPTASLINRFVGRDYISGVQTTSDRRGQSVSHSAEMGKQVVFKYNVGRGITGQDAPIYLYRAAEIHLMIAEALTAMGDYDAADNILNGGFQPYWVSGKRFNQPFDAPIYAFEKLRGGKGVRGRMNIPSINSTDTRFMSETPGTDAYNDRRRMVLDSLIAEETARELAFEGKRWFTMMRIARNSDRPELLANIISRKFPAGERAVYQTKLMDKNNWFIQYDLGTNNIE